MIWIIGGTKETKEVINRIARKEDYIVTTATYTGKEVLEDEKALIQRMDLDQMLEFIRNNAIQKVVDLSHPYALEVTENAKAAAKLCNIEYLRYLRSGTELKGAIVVNSIPECLELLKSLKGNIFFTTGMKNIKDFEAVRGNNRYIYRVLPAIYSIEECVKNKINPKDIVAILGPVSEEMNSAMFKEFKVDYVVMKDSGVEGGTLEKLAACNKLKLKAIVIGREGKEEGINNIDALVEKILC